MLLILSMGVVLVTKHEEDEGEALLPKKTKNNDAVLIFHLTVKNVLPVVPLDLLTRWCASVTKVGIPCGSKTFKRRMANSVTVRISA